MISEKNLFLFAVESNHIEGINSAKRHLNHTAALEKFLKLEKTTVQDLQDFVSAIEPSATLRNTDGHRVWIGGHEAPKGSLTLASLNSLLFLVDNHDQPNTVHKKYENIHPFMDGNGRSGRALWLWQMVNQRQYDGRYKFLQMYYYQTLGD